MSRHNAESLCLDSQPDPPQGQDTGRNDPPNPTVGWVSRQVLLRPRRSLIGRWNWKSALVSAIVRSAMFFRAVLGTNPPAALSASVVEFLLAFALAGFGGRWRSPTAKRSPNGLLFSLRPSCHRLSGIAANSSFISSGELPIFTSALRFRSCTPW